MTSTAGHLIVGIGSVEYSAGNEGSHKREKILQPSRQAPVARNGPTFYVAIAILIVIVWAIGGPVFHFSDTWQLVINTASSVVTFLMVFLIQNTQNRDDDAIQAKLAERNFIRKT